MELTGKIADNDLRAFRESRYIAGGHKIPRLWVVTADKKIARIFAKKLSGLELIGEVRPVADAVTELSNRSIGRTAESTDPSIRHKYEPRMNESRQESLSFVHELAGWLKRMNSEDVFDRLIIAAPPEVLGDLRTALDKKVRDRVIAETNKGLTGFNEKNLQQELENIGLLEF